MSGAFPIGMRDLLEKAPRPPQWGMHRMVHILRDAILDAHFVVSKRMWKTFFANS